MSKKNNWLYWSLGGMIIVMLIIYYNFFYIPPVSWVETYRKDDRSTYSTSVIYDLLSDLSPEHKVVESNMPAAKFLALQISGRPANYIFIGNEMILSQEDADSLISFARQGNQVFISCNVFPNNLNRRIFADFVDDVEEANAEEEMAVDTNIATEDPVEEVEEDTQQSSEDSLKIEDREAIAELTNDSVAANLFEEDAIIDSVATALQEGDTTKSRPKEYIYIFKTITDSVVHFRFRNNTVSIPAQQFRFQHLNDFRLQARDWTYINDSCSVNDSVRKILLGFLTPAAPVFYKYDMGKGSIFYHSLPLTLTDIYLTRPGGFEYANRIFSHLPTGNVYWDNFHKNSGSSRQNGNRPATPLRYIFSQPALVWAWYVGLAGVFMYLIFYAKRRQRTIPLQKPLINTTIEFVQTLALFFKKDGDKQIVEIREKYLKLYIWERYKIAPNLPLDAYSHKVSLYSGVAQKDILHIFSLANYIKKSPRKVSEELMQLHLHLSYFYKNSK